MLPDVPAANPLGPLRVATDAGSIGYDAVCQNDWSLRA
jgi:hypothetical protein